MDAKREISKKLLEELYINRGKTLKEISLIFNISYNYIRNLVTIYNIPIKRKRLGTAIIPCAICNKEMERPITELNKYPSPVCSKECLGEFRARTNSKNGWTPKKFDNLLSTKKEITKEQIVKLYLDENKNTNEISKILNVSQPTISNYLTVFNIKKDNEMAFKKEELESLYLIKNLQTKEIAKLTGIAENHIRYCLKKYNIKKPINEDISKDILYQLYVIERKATTQIGKILGYSKGRITYCIKKNGIPLRKLGEDNIGKRPGNYSREIFSCCICGHKVERKPCHITKRGRYTCSKKCTKERLRQDAQNRLGKNHPNYVERVERKCNYCGNKLIKLKTYIEKYPTSYCSPECLGKWRSENKCGEKSDSWLGGSRCDYGRQWTSIKRKINKRDKCCKICRKEKEENKLNCQVHHYIPFRVFGVENSDKANHPSNLGLYCAKDHAILEKINRLFWTNEFFDSLNIIETLPSIKNKDTFHCYSMYK